MQGPIPPPVVTWENKREQYAVPGCHTPGPCYSLFLHLALSPVSSLVFSMKPQPAFQEVTFAVTQPRDNWHASWLHIK